MSNNLQLATDFQTRIFDKIKSDIGSLMTDEQLKLLVEQAMKQAFFEYRTVEEYQSGWGNRKVEHPPAILKVIKELMETKVKTALEAWLNENEVEVKKMIQETFDKKILDCVRSAFERSVESKTGTTFQNIAVALGSLFQHTNAPRPSDHI